MTDPRARAARSEVIAALPARLRRLAEAVAALLLATIFVAFVIQIVFRYVFNLPVGWTSELSVVAWLWLVLWGAAFVLKDEDEIRFELVSGHAGRRLRTVLGIVAALAIVVLYTMSLPAAHAYVSFMKVERSSYLKLRFDWMYSIYLFFAVAVVVRYLHALWRLLRDSRAAAAGSSSTGDAA